MSPTLISILKWLVPSGGILGFVTLLVNRANNPARNELRVKQRKAAAAVLKSGLALLDTILRETLESTISKEGSLGPGVREDLIARHHTIETAMRAFMEVVRNAEIYLPPKVIEAFTLIEGRWAMSRLLELGWIDQFPIGGINKAHELWVQLFRQQPYSEDEHLRKRLHKVTHRYLKA